MLSEIFYTLLLTTLTGFFLKCASMMYKSKCKEVDFCCLKIIRDTESEEKEEEFRMTHAPLTPPVSSKKENDE